MTEFANQYLQDLQVDYLLNQDKKAQKRGAAVGAVAGAGAALGHSLSHKGKITKRSLVKAGVGAYLGSKLGKYGAKAGSKLANKNQTKKVNESYLFESEFDSNELKQIGENSMFLEITTILKNRKKVKEINQMFQEQIEDDIPENIGVAVKEYLLCTIDKILLDYLFEIPDKERGALLWVETNNINFQKMYTKFVKEILSKMTFY